MVGGVWCVVWWKLCRAQTEVELELELSDATRLRIDIIQERQQRLLCLPSFPHTHYWTNLPSLDTPRNLLTFLQSFNSAPRVYRPLRRQLQKKEAYRRMDQ